MRLTVVGCAGSFASADSPSSCYLVEHEGSRLLLDLGSGAIGGVQRHADVGEIDAVLLSHLHLDHCADLGGYYVMRKYHPSGPMPAIPVIGPRGVAQRITTMYGDASPESMGAVFDFGEHSSDPLRLGPFTITVSQVRHPVLAYATRVEAGGRSLVYSGDTGPTEALVEIARGADLALFEASFLESEVAGLPGAADIHMTARDAAELAARAGVERLVLTHLVAWNDRAATEAEAAPHFEGPLDLATAGMVVDV